MSHTVELGLARPDDAETIARLSRELIETGLDWRWRSPRVRQHIKAPETNVLLARDRQAIVVGFGIMHYRIEDAHLLLLAVTPRCQRRGLGRKLLEWLIEPARVAGIGHIDLEVRAGNTSALAFYRTLDFREIRRIPYYYDGRETAIHLARDLTGPR